MQRTIKEKYSPTWHIFTTHAMFFGCFACILYNSNVSQDAQSGAGVLV